MERHRQSRRLMCRRSGHHRRLLQIGTPSPTRLPFRDPAHELGIALIADEGPTLLVTHVVLGVDSAVLDQGLGVLEITVDGLDGCRYSVFLFCDDTFSISETVGLDRRRRLRGGEK